MEKENKYLGCAIVSIVFGFMAWLCFGIILGPVGLMLGITALVCDKGAATRTCAIIGTAITGIEVAYLLFTFMSVFYLWAIMPM